MTTKAGWLKAMCPNFHQSRTGRRRPRAHPRADPDLASLTETTMSGVHFVQEDSPDEIGTAVASSCGQSCHVACQRCQSPQSGGSHPPEQVGFAGGGRSGTWRESKEALV